MFLVIFLTPFLHNMFFTTETCHDVITAVCKIVGVTCLFENFKHFSPKMGAKLFDAATAPPTGGTTTKKKSTEIVNVQSI